jgi:hypothetical protein
MVELFQQNIIFYPNTTQIGYYFHFKTVLELHDALIEKKTDKLDRVEIKPVPLRVETRRWSIGDSSRPSEENPIALTPSPPLGVSRTTAHVRAYCFRRSLLSCPRGRNYEVFVRLLQGMAQLLKAGGARTLGKPVRFDSIWYLSGKRGVFTYSLINSRSDLWYVRN